MGVLGHFILWNLGVAKPWTFYNDKECAALEHYAKGKKRLVEIGCWQGVNTARLRRAMAPDGILFAVDPYPVGRFGFSAPQVIAHREVGKIHNGTVQWLRMTDLDAADYVQRQAEAPFDLIFSDSLNTYEGFKACWDAWNPKMDLNGIYILANSSSDKTRNFEQAGSVQFTKKVILADRRFRHLETVGTFTILERLS